MIRPQPWDWPGPRVLLEEPYNRDTAARVDALRRAGYAVAVCPGPAPGDKCPLACGEGCRAAEGADLVVSAVGAEIAETVRRALPGRALIVLDAPPAPHELVDRVRTELRA